MKAVFFIIGLLLTALVGFQGYLVFNQELPQNEGSAHLTNIPLTTKDKPQVSGAGQMEKVSANEKAIIQRNLFKVTLNRTSPIGQTNPAAAPVVLEKTRLKLALLGTVAGNKTSDGWAVIEDLKKRQQSLYRVGDQIQNGIIKSISRNLVVLTVDGEDEILEADTRKGGGKEGDNFHPKNMEPKFLSASENMSSPVNSPAAVFSAMKTRTYFKDGQPAGLMVFGTKPGANLSTLGLQKGDILRSVNDTPIQSQEDIDAIAEELDPALDIKISLYRRGNPKELIYYGQEQTFTIESAKE